MRLAALIAARPLAAACICLLAVPLEAPLTAPLAAQGSRSPPDTLRRYEAVLAADSTDYTANRLAALALIDIAKQTPDSVKSPERDSLYVRAERYARRAVAADPDSAEGWFVMANAIGRASLTMGKKARIRRATEIRDAALRAIALDPRHDGAYHVLGRWNAEIMRLSGLSRFFAKSFLGADVFGEASWDGAIANLEKAVDLAPQRIYHHLDLAEVYIDRKRYADARRQLEAIGPLPLDDVMDAQYKADAERLLQEIAAKADREEQAGRD